MTIAYQDNQITLHHADCRKMLADIPDNSIDSCVTDPPYELTGSSGKGGFIGLSWDATGIAFDTELWAEVLRVLKPGGHLMAFGGSRTWHRLAVAIEDAGFQLRDPIAWLHQDILPKGQWADRLTDRMLGAKRPVTRVPYHDTFTFDGNNKHKWQLEAEKAGYMEIPSDEPITEEAKRLYGWNSALRPVFEPIAIGRKPMTESFARNMLEHGVGGYNIKATGGDGFTPNAATDGLETGCDLPAFVYVPKTPAKERPRVNGITHPTPKPVNLMRHLIRLVTPRGGCVLELFGGSGATFEGGAVGGLPCGWQRDVRGLHSTHH
ncbi:DNA-methyltransferase [Bifidobacterium crudilactis]|uniref:DNA-methyltransferase n=1 Tax=Bifidobacterium crudilactis TaxID=327277 RepID=UPI00068C3503|nr:DNA methyltransferase [Bifidobacterium crudilactis]